MLKNRRRKYSRKYGKLSHKLKEHQERQLKAAAKNPYDSPPTRITIALVPYNEWRLFQKLTKQIETRTNKYNYEIEIIIVDNSDAERNPEFIQQSANELGKIFNVKYIKNQRNVRLAQATNQIIQLADSKYFIYMCSRHTYIYHADWLKDMVEYMRSFQFTNPCMMAGHILPFGQNLEPEKDIHVQGGLYIADTEYLKTHPYDHINYPHIYMDTNYTRNLFLDKKTVQNIPSVLSLPGVGWSIQQHNNNKQFFSYKIVHCIETINYS